MLLGPRVRGWGQIRIRCNIKRLLANSTRHTGALLSQEIISAGSVHQNLNLPWGAKVAVQRGVHSGATVPAQLGVTRHYVPLDKYIQITVMQDDKKTYEIQCPYMVKKFWPWPETDIWYLILDPGPGIIKQSWNQFRFFTWFRRCCLARVPVSCWPEVERASVAVQCTF